MPFEIWTRVAHEVCVRWGAHWRHLANTIELSMCGGDAAFLSNYFDHLLFINAAYNIINHDFNGGLMTVNVAHGGANQQKLPGFRFINCILNKKASIR